MYARRYKIILVTFYNTQDDLKLNLDNKKLTSTCGDDTQTVNVSCLLNGSAL